MSFKHQSKQERRVFSEYLDEFINDLAKYVFDNRNEYTQNYQEALRGLVVCLEPTKVFKQARFLIDVLYSTTQVTGINQTIFKED